jgi:HAD superfamily hydrolase (TIGR01509 family)
MYQLAIFDFDGTLVDSAPGIVDVMKLVADEYEMTAEQLALWTQLIGVPLVKQAEIICPDRTAAFHEEVAARYRAIYDTKVLEICPVFPGVEDLLIDLNKAGVKVTIASSKRRCLVETVLDHYDLGKYFELVIGMQDVNNHKPHPESVHHTVSKLKLNKQYHDVVVIGDSSFDLDMAKNAGVDSIGVTTGIHTHDILTKSDPRFIIDTVSGTLPLILEGKAKKAKFIKPNLNQKSA